jgi:hypothetical protein
MAGKTPTSKTPTTKTPPPTLHFTLANGTTIVGRPTSLAKVLAIAIASRTTDVRRRKPPATRRRQAG